MRLRLERRKEVFIWKKHLAKWKREFEYSFTLHEKEIELTNSTLIKLKARGFKLWVRYKRVAQMWRRKEARVRQTTQRNTVRLMWRGWRKGTRWGGLVI